MRQVISRQEISDIAAAAPRLAAFLGQGFTAFAPEERTRSRLVGIAMGLAVMGGAMVSGKLLPKVSAAEGFSAYDVPVLDARQELEAQVAADVDALLLNADRGLPDFSVQQSPPVQQAAVPALQRLVTVGSATPTSLPIPPQPPYLTQPRSTPGPQAMASGAPGTLHATTISPEDAIPPSILRAALHAASSTGMDAAVLLSVAATESGMRTSVKNRSSSAQGAFQFTRVAWFEAIYRFGADHGLSWLTSRISQQPGGAMVVDHATRSHILALRDNPAMAAVMAAAVMQADCRLVERATGHKANLADMYLIHLMGTSGASHFASVASAGSNARSDSVAGRGVTMNRGLFTQDGHMMSASKAYAGMEQMMQAKRRHYAAILATMGVQSAQNLGGGLDNSEVAYAPGPR